MQEIAFFLANESIFSRHCGDEGCRCFTTRNGNLPFLSRHGGRLLLSGWLPDRLILRFDGRLRLLRRLSGRYASSFRRRCDRRGGQRSGYLTSRIRPIHKGFLNIHLVKRILQGGQALVCLVKNSEGILVVFCLFQKKEELEEIEDDENGNQA